jgi:hypothetical protein
MNVCRRPQIQSWITDIKNESGVILRFQRVLAKLLRGGGMMRRNVAICMIIAGSWIALQLHAEQNSPIVQIPSKVDAQNRTRTTVLSPAIIQIDTRMDDSEVVPPTPMIDPSETRIPVGGVIAWMKSMPNTPPLPEGWVECNGQEILDAKSPYHKTTAPNLNGSEGTTKRFLRGATESGAVGGSETHSHGAVRSQKYGNQRKPVGATVQITHLPPFYNVVWIMRVR